MRWRRGGPRPDVHHDMKFNVDTVYPSNRIERFATLGLGCTQAELKAVVWLGRLRGFGPASFAIRSHARKIYGAVTRGYRIRPWDRKWVMKTYLTCKRREREREVSTSV